MRGHAMAAATNEQFRTWTHATGRKLVLVSGDITVEGVDAIVNAAGSHMQHGGGVAAAIANRGGPVIRAESKKFAPVAAGTCVITSAGDLPARWVIHTVGPRWGEGDEDAKLASAIKCALVMADEYGVESISFPAVSTGIFAFPLERAAGIILDTIRKYLDKEDESSVREIRLCLFDRQTLLAFDGKLSELLEG
ncbi:MAG: O-acetyl-ADP-ribose deacetylase [Calditrichaeota bacterium]|nr:O-acetyl-ADP-ribose deacetylase [Calditrichota bacterium]